MYSLQLMLHCRTLFFPIKNYSNSRHLNFVTFTASKNGRLKMLKNICSKFYKWCENFDGSICYLKYNFCSCNAIITEELKFVLVNPSLGGNIDEDNVENQMSCIVGWLCYLTPIEEIFYVIVFVYILYT